MDVAALRSPPLSYLIEPSDSRIHGSLSEWDVDRCGRGVRLDARRFRPPARSFGEPHLVDDLAHADRSRSVPKLRDDPDRDDVDGVVIQVTDRHL